MASRAGSNDGNTASELPRDSCSIALSGMDMGKYRYPVTMEAGFGRLPHVCSRCCEWVGHPTGPIVGTHDQ